MKSAYELAMERLNKTAPPKKLTAREKADLAELDSKYQAKIAERELFLKGEIAKFVSKGDFEELPELERQLANNRKALMAELEEKKDALRNKRK